MMKRVRLLISCLSLCALVSAACIATTPVDSTNANSRSEAAPGATSLATLNWNFRTEPPTLDPSLATDGVSVSIIDGLFLGLTELDPKTQEAMPELATQWDVSKDGLVWTFHLRTDVPWVHVVAGKVVPTDIMVTAGDVAYGLKRTCDSATASDYAYVLYIVAGCEAANSGEGGVDDVGVTAVDDSLLEITLTHPASYFSQIASMWIMRPMPEATIEEYGDDWTEPEHILSDGPFALSEWIHGDHIQLIRNRRWYGWKEMADVVGNLEVINGSMVDGDSTAFALYQDNKLDAAMVPLEMMDSALAGKFGDELHISPINCTYYYGFVTKKAGVSDVRVRRALSMAVDRRTLVDDVLKGGQIPANTFTNPLNFGSPAGDADIAPWALSKEQGGAGYAAALAMARDLMVEAGHPNGAGLNLTLANNTGEGHATIAETIQAMWAKAFPEMQLTIDTQEWDVFLDNTAKDAPLESKPDIYRGGWCADYPHANNWIHEVFNPTQGENLPLLSTDDPEIGALVQEFNDATIAAQSASPDEQRRLYKRAEEIFIDEVVGIIPIYYYTEVMVYKPWLSHVTSDSGYFYRWSINQSAKEATY